MMKKLKITALKYDYNEVRNMLPLGESFCVNSLTVNYLGNDRYELSDDDYEMTIAASGDEICKYIYASILHFDIMIKNQNVLERNPELDDIIRCLDAQYLNDDIATYDDFLRKIIAAAEEHNEF